ncbi:cytochrome b/b6 domain-containing protein [Paracoccus denitrificans]|jgi:cytochrome b|uniref:Cytochrome B561 n=1 Tax=Paracoccus denitrificans (strain Pd 1222) TaxID=318586 RepID=A1BB66_PARDP|nr:cytochrome b/b6 domain-containing protein [Paracoccus denitrificans]ABL72760.1 cytochrome B561 [Paracoccus denitrificans PD1222]MBB4626238.1 cytochrome b [Paracoccus denitrificans]MCU7427555.1 cytochrome b/b6 domain-containing protein [Paracoccus denitrificans]QAR29722.1 cytochrome B [Paracoccus denitrificans]UPV98499.1 cytochrome b/b6 domain-containing protein [Paracoccus denitrificans]
MRDDTAVAAADQTQLVRLWDLPLRIFHWALAACVAAAWGLGKFGPDIMTLHFLFGYAVIGLLAFRLLWGFVGPRPARFRSCLHGPRTVLAYLRQMPARSPSHWPGHNPLGGLFVILLLLALAAQVATGLVADPQDYVNTGPLADAVSSRISRMALNLHDIIGNMILLMVLLHVAVVLFYRLWKRENLIRPMITGWKRIRM